MDSSPRCLERLKLRMVQNGLHQLANSCVHTTDQLGLLRVVPGSQMWLHDLAKLPFEVTKPGVSRRVASLRQSVEQESGAQMVLLLIFSRLLLTRLDSRFRGND